MFYDMTEMASKTIPSFQINQNFQGELKIFPQGRHQRIGRERSQNSKDTETVAINRIKLDSEPIILTR